MTSFKTGPVDPTKPMELDDGTPVELREFSRSENTVRIFIPGVKDPDRVPDGLKWEDEEWSYSLDTGVHETSSAEKSFILRNVAPQIGHNGGPSIDVDGNARFPTAVVNPKELAGAKKPAVWSVMPRWVSLAVGRVMSVGAAKYGAFNYRDSNIAASTYQDAIERHLALWFDGEDNDDETGVSHLASVVASCALLMDAQQTGRLHDDRQKTGNVRPYLDDLTELLKTKPLPDPQY